ncbi:hypothetical protein ACJ73_02881 [Blastomyces percursus]|uniref:Uncharacterized protein n=1 Tax=Blastomyces percursus TaxID=1658174 RepID=A0A1J9RDL6_9EURO|nr:hypothetical protein ACJ73_02881 [Blastomyces percursus]
MRMGKIGLRPSIRPTTTNAYEVTDCRPCDTSSWNGGAGQKNDIGCGQASLHVWTSNASSVVRLNRIALALFSAGLLNRLTPLVSDRVAEWKIGEGHGFGLQIMAMFSDRVAECQPRIKMAWTTVSDRRPWPKNASAATPHL